MNQLLSLEEIPDEFEVKIGKFTVEKLPIVCGPLVDTQDLGLPTLHDALQSAFLSISSGLVTIGAICSAVFKKNELYIFFDSHCHGENGLSSSDGASCLMTFSSLDDLITYMYAFYDSLKLDTGLQFDFLPINLKRCEEKLSCKDEMASHLEAYFKDQNVRQAKKTQSNACAQHKYASKIESLSKKRKPRYGTEYYRISKQLSRMDPTFKAKELMNQKKSKQSARKDPAFKAKEIKFQKESKQSERRNPTFKAKEIMYQKESKQTARKHPAFKRKEIESKQSERQDPTFKAKEIMYQKESKQTARKNPAFKRKEIKSKQSERRDPAFKAKEIMYQKESKQSERRNPIFKAEEIKYQKESKQTARKSPAFKRKEIESKQSATKEPVYKTKERESKQLARKNPSFRTKETVYQKESKRKARENPYFLECERIKKQQIRQEKRKFNDDSGIDVPRKRCKHNTDTLPKSHQKDLTIDESIKRFHSDIAIGPLYVCSCCHQTWFRKSVSMLKNTHTRGYQKVRALMP